MKKLTTIILFAITVCIANNSFSQEINWAGIQPESKHIVNVNVGWDYGLVLGVGYGYQLNTKWPAILNISYSAPAGEHIFDDYKVKIGGQVRVINIHNFGFTANLNGVFRRYENPMVSMLNFGSDFSGVIGYYQPNWFVGGEVGFDKAIVSYFKHSDIYKDDTYENVQDGWYEPAAGGNFYYGIQTGFSMKQSDITFGLGKVIEQDFKTAPYIPYYARLGFNMKINGLNNHSIR